MVADGANRSAATRYIKRTEGQTRYGRDSRRHGYQQIKKKVERLRREARGQGVGRVTEGAFYPYKSRFCILERSRRGRSPLQSEPYWSPFLPPCPYSGGASGSREDWER